MSAAIFVAIPGSYRVAAYARAAQAAGLEPVVVTRANAAAVPPDTTGIAVDFNHYPTIARTVLEAMAGRHVSVVLGVDDTSVEIASRLAREFKVKHNSIEATRLSTQKHLSRERLFNAGLRVPAHALIASHQSLSRQQISFDPPWVVKPVDLSASRGVIRADTWPQLQKAAKRSRTIALGAGGSGALLIEQYINGYEIAVDAIFGNRGFQPLAIFDKPEPLTGPYFEESIYVTPSRLTTTEQYRVEQALVAACEVLGIVTGPVHAEFRIADDLVWILEIATRTIGGECASIFESLLPISIEQLVLEYATGKTVKPELDGAAGVYMLPVPEAGVLRRVNGIAQAEKIIGVTGVSIAVREGYELIPWPEGCSYPGFVFAQAQSPQMVVNALTKAADLIEFTVSPSFPVATTGSSRELQA